MYTVMITNLDVQALLFGLFSRCPSSSKVGKFIGFMPPNGVLPPLNISQQVIPNDH